MHVTTATSPADRASERIATIGAAVELWDASKLIERSGDNERDLPVPGYPGRAPKWEREISPVCGQHVRAAGFSSAAR